MDRYRAVAEALPHIVWAADAEGSITYLNRHGNEYLGRPAGASYGSGWVDTVHPDDAERAARTWERALEAGEPYSIEYRVRRHDGEYRWHADAGVPVRDAGGEIVGWVGTLTDVERRVRSEATARQAELRASETLALLETLQREAPVGFAFVDMDLRFVRINEALAEIDGMPVEDHLGRTVEEVAPELWPTLKPIYERVLSTGEPELDTEIVGETRAAPGETRVWRASYYPVRDGEDELLGIGLIVTEETERARIDAELRARLGQQAAVAELGRLALRERAAAPTMDAAVELLAERLGADYTAILRLEPGGERARLVAGHGWPDELIGEATTPTGGDTQIGFALRSDEPLVAADLASESRFPAPPELLAAGAVSALTTVIRVRGEPWGIIGVQTRARREFGDDDVNFADSVAHVVAGAIEVAEADRERGLYGAVLEGMAEGVAVARMHEEGSTLEYANSQFARMLGYEPDELRGEETARLLGAEGMSDERRAAIRAELARVGSWDGEIEGATKEGEARIFATHLTMLDPGADGPLVAVVVADETERRDLERQLEARLAQQASLAELGQLALRGRSPEATMRAAVALLAERLGVELTKVLRLEPGGEELRLVAGVGWREGLVGEAAVGAGLDSQAGYTLQEEEPVIVADLPSEARFSGPPLLREHGVVSGISTMIEVRGVAWGVLGVHASQRREFTDHDVNFVSSVAHVIGAALEAEEADREARLHETVFHRMADGVIVWRLGEPLGTIEYANPSFAAMLGFPAERLRGANLESFSAEDEETRRALTTEIHAKLRQDGAWQREVRARSSGGDARTMNVRASLLEDYAPNALCGAVLTDVTEQRRAEETRRRADEMRRRLLAELVGAQEKERHRIAADIHDDTLQTLSAVKLRLGMLREHDGKRERGEMLDALERDLQQGITELRGLLFELRPPALAEGGLEPALRDLLDELARDGGPAGRIVGSLRSEPSLETRTILYRIAREALINVRRHARSERVEVSLAESNGTISVRIRDFGVGFSPDEAAMRPGHLGLTGMRERAEMAGGWLHVRSRPGAGTTVDFAIPHDAAVEAE